MNVSGGHGGMGLGTKMRQGVGSRRGKGTRTLIIGISGSSVMPRGAGTRRKSSNMLWKVSMDREALLVEGEGKKKKQEFRWGTWTNGARAQELSKSVRHQSGGQRER